MNNSFSQAPGPGGGDNGPPGQNMLGILLAATTSIFLTPYVFTLIGPFVERLTLDAYGSREFADIMYWASFILCGGVIYAASRLIYWYVLAALVAYLAMRSMSGIPAIL